MRFDITVAVTAHAESVVSGPTMRSAEIAIKAAESEGFSVERLVGFDAPSDLCRDFFSQQAFSDWKSYDFEFRDQGRTRNALTEISTARWVAVLDADDLVSENWFASCCRLLGQAERSGQRVIVHPELNWVFDAGTFVFTKPAQDDSIFAPQYFAITNYYDAVCTAPREAFVKTRYPDRNIPAGFAFEDWQWNIETMAKGWCHVVAMDTIIFKRRRDSSQTHESRGRVSVIRQLEPMAIDRVMKLGRSEG
jgi:hypothetical protein